MLISQRGALHHTVENANLNRRILCSVWVRVMKLCTHVHLLKPNKFPIRTYKLQPLHFLQITLLWKMLKEAVCSFWCHLVVKSKSGPSAGLSSPHTVVAIIYTIQFQTMPKTVVLFCNGSLAASLTNWSFVQKLCRMVKDHSIYLAFWVLAPHPHCCLSYIYLLFCLTDVKTLFKHFLWPKNTLCPCLITMNSHWSLPQWSVPGWPLCRGSPGCNGPLHRLVTVQHHSSD